MILIITLILVSLFFFVFSLWWWPLSTCSMTLEEYSYIVGNGSEVFLDIAPIMWPYTKTSSQISITFSFTLPMLTPIDPSLPILVSLPTNNSQEVFSVIVISSRVLPNLKIVQHDSDHIAFTSNDILVTGSLLITGAWQITFIVVYNIL